MSLLSDSDNVLIMKHYSEMLSLCYRSQDAKSKELIQKAFDLAYSAHKGVRRASGEPYILHPIAVAKICAEEIGLGTTGIIAALLHDVVEDTDYTVSDISNMFGDKVSYIVNGLTKIDSAFQFNPGLQTEITKASNNSKLQNFGVSMQAENFRKILITISQDIRVVLIKLADRLHNLRTIDSMPPNSQMRTAAETMYLYAPLAHRLGMNKLKSELEDLCLKVQQPTLYQEIVEKIKLKENEKERITTKFVLPIVSRLIDDGIKFRLASRSKSIYSIAKKIQEKGVTFDQIYDVMAIRLIFDPSNEETERAECWRIFDIVTSIYSIKPDRTRDWITTPKANGYTALHLTVMSNTGQFIEVQIRSTRMDELAERGIAAHYVYKGYNSESDSEFGQHDDKKPIEFDQFIKKVREVLENPEASALEFLDSVKMEMFSPEILTFSPKGDIVHLPINATALDYAFEIHTNIAFKAIAAKVNYKLTSLNQILFSGDQVEIITSPKASPKAEWLDFVITSKAKTRLKLHFKKERKESILQGAEILQNRLRELNIELNNKIIEKLVRYFELENKEELFYNICNQMIDSESIEKAVNYKQTNSSWSILDIFRKKGDTQSDDTIIPEKFSKDTVIRLTDNFDTEKFEFAKCCAPIPGDDAIGFKFPTAKKMIIHKAHCDYAIKLGTAMNKFIARIDWKTHKNRSFPTGIYINGIDRKGILHEITGAITTSSDTDIRSVNMQSSDGIFKGRIDLEVHNKEALEKLMDSIKAISGVKDIKRLDKKIK